MLKLLGCKGTLTNWGHVYLSQKAIFTMTPQRYNNFFNNMIIYKIFFRKSLYLELFLPT